MSSFRQIYRQQYRQESARRTPRALRWIAPVVLVAFAFVPEHSAAVQIALGAAAVVVFAVLIVLVQRERSQRRQ